MITTVTTTTTALTTTTTASLTLLVSLVLIALLVQQEIISSIESDWAKRTMRRINVVVPPLFIVFLVSVVVHLLDLLR